MAKRPAEEIDTTASAKRPRVSPRLIVKGKRVITGGKVLHNAYVVSSGNIIVSVQTETPGGLLACDLLQADIVIPGLIDIHHHGICGGETKEVTEFWLSDETAKKLPSLGSTAVLASVSMTGDEKHTNALLASLEEQVSRGQPVDRSEPPRARVSGIHAIFSTSKHYADMSTIDFISLLNKMPSCRIMTVSPSVEASSGYTRLRELLRRQVTPALGHDANTSLDAILGCLRVAGTQRLHLTHLFDSCSFETKPTFDHREPGLINIGLLRQFPATPQYKGMLAPTIELVADCANVHPLMVHLTLQARGPSEVALVSDAILHEHAEPGEFEYAGKPIEVRTEVPVASGIPANGTAAGAPAASSPTAATAPKTVVFKDSNVIAGGCSTPLVVLRRVVQDLGVPLAQAVTMLTETPARIAKLEDLGSIAVGYKSDMLLLSDSLDLQTVVIDGRIAFQGQNKS